MSLQITIWMMRLQDFSILETLQILPGGRGNPQACSNVFNLSTIVHKNCVKSLLSLSDFNYPQVLNAESILYCIYLSCHFCCYFCSALWFKLCILFNIQFFLQILLPYILYFQSFCKHFWHGLNKMQHTH